MQNRYLNYFFVIKLYDTPSYNSKMFLSKGSVLINIYKHENLQVRVYKNKYLYLTNIQYFYKNTLKFMCIHVLSGKIIYYSSNCDV